MQTVSAGSDSACIVPFFFVCCLEAKHYVNASNRRKKYANKSQCVVFSLASPTRKH